MTATTTPAFEVDWALVDRLRALIVQVVELAQYTRLEVSETMFPAWCAALSVESFMSFTGKGRHQWVSTTSTRTVVVNGQNTTHVVSVGCDRPPAPWVEFPRGEGDRRWMFHAVPRPLPAAESTPQPEST